VRAAAEAAEALRSEVAALRGATRERLAASEERLAELQARPRGCRGHWAMCSMGSRTRPALWAPACPLSARVKVFNITGSHANGEYVSVCERLRDAQTRRLEHGHVSCVNVHQGMPERGESMGRGGHAAPGVDGPPLWAPLQAAAEAAARGTDADAERLNRDLGEALGVLVDHKLHVQRALEGVHAHVRAVAGQVAAAGA